MLLNWLPGPSEPCPVPPFATHVIGVGGLVVNHQGEVLCVREATPPSGLPPMWKLPGGLMDLGEEISEAVAREVLEETGVKARFKSILNFRHQVH